MFIYFILIIILGVFALIEWSKYYGDIKVYYFSYFLVFLVCSLRTTSVGTDTLTYVDIFKHGIGLTPMEPGFLLVVDLLREMSDSSAVFIFVISILQLLPLYYVFSKVSENKSLSLLIFILGEFMFLYLSGMRQSISISFIMLSLYFLVSEKKIFALLFFFISISFHVSAIIFLPLIIIIKHFRVSTKRLILYLILSILIGFTALLSFESLIKLISLIPNEFSGGFIDKIQFYVDYKSDVQKSFVGFMYNTIPLSLIALYIYVKYPDRNDLFLRVFIIGVIISNLLIKSIMGPRLVVGLLMFQTLLIPMFLKNVKNKALISYMLIGFLFFRFSFRIYSVYSFSSNMGRNDVVPYSTIIDLF